MSVLLLVWTVVAALLGGNRPVLPAAAEASPRSPAAVQPLRPALAGAQTPQAPVREEAYLTPAAPTLAAAPTLVSRPAGSARPLTHAGPTVLALWTGQTISVEPAQGQIDHGVYRWTIPAHAAGWHTDTPDCGQGVTIVGGHVKWDGAPGVFASLATIGENGTVVCVDGQNAFHTYRPIDFLLVAGDSDPTTWRPAWERALILYTCTPELDGRILVIRFEEKE